VHPPRREQHALHRRQENEAEGVTLLTVFMDDESSSSFPWVIGEDHDRFVRTEYGWRIKSRRWRQLFSRSSREQP